MKLLLDPSLAPERKQEAWRALSSRLTGERLASIESVNLSVYEDENSIELEAYIGFRHVNGVMEWGAFEKAKFIARLVEVHAWSYKQIAERLGSYARHIERHYIAHQLIAQAIEAEIPGAEEVRLGVLLRALQAAGIADFLGISYPGDPAQSKSPVDTAHMDNFRDFVCWTFGSDEAKPVLPDSRDLTKWGKILQSTEALRYMRKSTSPSFDRAWLKSGGERESVVESLLTAADRLEESVALAPQHKDEDDVRQAVKRCATYVGMLLRDFPQAREAFGG